MANRHTLTHQGCGTHRVIEWVQDYGAHDEIETVLQDTITDFDIQYSRFHADSLLSRFNRGEITSGEDHDLNQMIALGNSYTSITDGVFSLSVGDVLYDLGYGKIHNRIDLGGIGKGYLISLLEQIFARYGINAYCINGGGDIAIHQKTSGTFGPLFLRHPVQPEQYIAQIQLLGGACASSGTQYRHRGSHEEHHHLIDMTTQKPSTSPYLSVHVVHEDIIRADVAATALFVSPLDAFEGLAKRLGVEWMIVFYDETTLCSSGLQRMLVS